VFRRYNITDESDLRNAVAKLAQHLSGETKGPKTAKGTQRGPRGLKLVNRAG
jgi:hypothetical protein